MNFRLTLSVLGGLLIFLGATLLAPIPFALYYRDGQFFAFLLSAAVTTLTGAVLLRFFRSREEIGLREGFAIVTFAWVGFALFGSLPYLLSGSLPNPIDAFFESMSGFTTCGASVYTDVEANPRSVLFWRALTQWIGGMGIIVLGIAILPLLGVGGMQLYEAETAGLSPAGDRLTPRIQDTARLIWGIYAIFTVLGIALYWVGEMDFYDAVCHTFAAIATGGFSTRNASLGAFGHYSQVVTIFLMVVGGINFSLHYFALRGKFRRFWISDEFRLYMGLLAGATAVIFLFNLAGYDAALANLVDSAFTAVSIMTCTGFATADYELWPFFSQGLLVLLMFLGGSAGSTSGGIKQVRVALLLKHAWQQTAQLIHPRRVRVLKLDRRAVSADVVKDVLGFVVLFLAIFVIASMLLTAFGVDLITAGSSVIACLSTVGPGLGQVGPADNYAGLPYLAKIVLSVCMLLGRLEIFTVLVLLFASFWKK